MLTRIWNLIIKELPLVDGGSVSVGVIIPEGFAAALTDPTSPPPQVQVIVDGSEPAAAQTAIGSAQGVVATFGQRVTVQPAAFSNGTLTPIDARVRVRFNEELKESNYTVPSEMGFMLAAIAMMVASLGIARERELGTLEQLMVTPMRPIELVIGKAVPAIIAGRRMPQIADGLARAGIAVQGVRTTRPRMEEAFISLIRRLEIGD